MGCVRILVTIVGIMFGAALLLAVILGILVERDRDRDRTHEICQFTHGYRFVPTYIVRFAASPASH